jgi:hypothetical protein
MFLLAGSGGIFISVAGVGIVTIGLLGLAESLGAAGDALYNVTVSSLRQSLTPDRLLGRVAASARFVIWGAQPFGALLGGVLGETIGLRPTLAIAVAGWFVAFLTLIVSPIRGLRAQPVSGEASFASLAQPEPGEVD